MNGKDRCKVAIETNNGEADDRRFALIPDAHPRDPPEVGRMQNVWHRFAKLLCKLTPHFTARICGSVDVDIPMSGHQVRGLRVSERR